MCQSSMRFVFALAVQYQHRGLKLEELIPIGTEGLKEATPSYDFESVIPFVKYAVPVMRHCLKEVVFR